MSTGSPGAFAECLTLDLSNGSLPSGRLSAMSQHSDKGRVKSPCASETDTKDDLESESSDWDSWDDEEDEVSLNPFNTEWTLPSIVLGRIKSSVGVKVLSCNYTE